MRDEVVLAETDPRAGLTHALVEYVIQNQQPSWIGARIHS
jgi:hypothetical protein